MDLQEVLAWNRAQQARARELNTRAGERVFPVMSPEEATRWLKERLGGARSVKEVKDLQVIAFPELDRELVDLVVGENPDEIPVLGKSLKVEYRGGSLPRVTLDHEMTVAHGWRELPDAGVKLPGGRLVEIVVSFGYYDTVSGQDIPDLKSRCHAHANQRAWSDWRFRGCPVIPLPDPAEPTSTVPEIVEFQYGTSSVDGTALIAFGAVGLKDGRYWASDPWFAAKWFQTRKEADAARAESAAKLESLREEAIKQKQWSATTESIHAVRAKLLLLRGTEGWSDVGIDLRCNIEDRCWLSVPSESLEARQAWLQETEPLVAKAEAALRSVADKKAAAERKQREAATKPATGEAVNATLAALQAKFGKKR